jgi:phosphatidate cytidylyltransferase
MHFKRLIVAAILLPIIYLYIMRLPAQYFLILLTCVSTIALMEFYSLYLVKGALRYSCLVLGTVLMVSAFFSRELLLEIIVVSVLSILTMRLFLKKDPLSSLRDIAPPIVGLLYIPVLLTFQIQIRMFGPEWIIFLYALVWGADSMAYYVGKGFGKRKLYTAVSPNKTIAGAVGSVVGGALCSFLLSYFLIPSLNASPALVIGIMIGFTTIIGDLVESMFKRDAGNKDSGFIIPGHGGILDKIDGMLFGGPVLYFVLLAMGITHGP